MREPSGLNRNVLPDSSVTVLPSGDEIRDLLEKPWQAYIQPSKPRVKALTIP